MSFVPQRTNRVGFVVQGSNASVVADYRSDQSETYLRFFSSPFGSNTAYIMGSSNITPTTTALLMGRAIPAGTTFRPNTEFILTDGRIGIGTGAQAPLASLHISNSNYPHLLRLDNCNLNVPAFLVTNTGTVCVNSSNTVATGLNVEGNAYLSDTLVADKIVVNSRITINGITYSNLNSNIFVDATDASRLTQGTLDPARLAVSGVAPGTYGGTITVPVVTVDIAGRVTSATQVPYTSSQWSNIGCNLWVVGSNVGIGTTLPATTFQVSGGGLFGSLAITEASATAPMYAGSLLSQNTGVGVGALASVTTGTNNTALGQNAGNDGLITITTQNNIVVLGNNNSTGGLYCKSGTINTSDSRDKVDVEPLDAGLDYILRLRPVSYCWDDRDWYPAGTPPDGSLREHTRRVGFLAQDIQGVEKDLGLPFDHVLVPTNPDKLCIQPGNLVPILANAVRELSDQLAELRAEVRRLTAQPPSY